jgi:tripartite ATP-independent transporter DctM subunit
VIVGVLASIFSGMATPTEAAAVGVVGALICAAIKKKLTFPNLKNMLTMTVSLSGMFLWLLISAVAYARIVSATGVGSWVASWISDLDVNRWVILLGMHLVFFILGMFLDAGAILFITAPFFIPVVNELGFDLIWFGILWILNMCIGSMTPPFGFSLFVLRGVAPDIKMNDIYWAVVPFILLYFVVIALVMIFPDLALWLPEKMME